MVPESPYEREAPGPRDGAVRRAQRLPRHRGRLHAAGPFRITAAALRRTCQSAPVLLTRAASHAAGPPPVDASPDATVSVPVKQRHGPSRFTLTTSSRTYVISGVHEICEVLAVLELLCW